MLARHSRPGRSTSRTDPVSRCSSLFYCSLDPDGFFYLEPMAVRTQTSADVLISTTTTTTPTPNRRNSSTDLAWSRSRGCRASSTSTIAGSMSMPSMATELLISLFAASKPTSEFKFHPYLMYARTVAIGSSHASTSTTLLQSSRTVARSQPLHEITSTRSDDLAARWRSLCRRHGPARNIPPVPQLGNIGLSASAESRVRPCAGEGAGLRMLGGKTGLG